MKYKALKINFILLSVTLFVMCAGKNPTEAEKTKKWVPVNNGLTSLTIQCIAPVKGSAGTLYAGTLHGVFKTVNSGGNWTQANTGLTSYDTKCLAVNPANGNLVFCGTWGSGVFKTANGGQTWEYIWKSGQDPRIYDITYGGNGFLWAGTRNGLYKSADQGENWEKSYPDGNVLSVAANPENPREIFIGVEYRGNFKSIDNGNNWQDINNGIYGDKNSSSGILAANNFAFDPVQPSTIFLSTGSVDIYKTINNGEKWTQYPEDLSDFKVVHSAVDPSNPQKVWAATLNLGVMLSVDGGEKWAEFNDGLTTKQMKTLGIAGSDNPVIYAGTVSEGIFRYGE
ncbi:hypothetical protein JXQ31_04725 [candidate division KSB1 bacterium]|nr:hypothetical protein [candidate division KSB1 bacterium]